MTDTLKIVTLNTWCPPQAKHREIRILTIAEKIQQIAPDVVCLQEMFIKGNRESMIAQLRATYPHYHYFSSGLLGSGLLTLSKYPIIDAYLQTFRLKGKPEKIHHGDYYVAKGVGLTRVQTPNGIVDIYNTHTHAQYEMANDNEYAVFNHTNLYEIARFIMNQSAENPVILCGDLNTRPDQLGYRIITHFTNLIDIYPHLHPNSDGFTYSEQNPYVTSPNQRLDYIMVKNGVKPQSIEIDFTELHSATTALAHSDHYGLVTTVSFEAVDAAPSHYDTKNILKESLFELERELGLANAQQIHHTEQAVLGILTLIDTQITGRFLKKYLPQLATLLKGVTITIAFIYGVYHAINALYNLRVRKNVIEEIISELRHQLTEK